MCYCITDIVISYEMITNTEYIRIGSTLDISYNVMNGTEYFLVL
jgi:hypothetical protein